jgi:hypothetical protein
MCHFRTAAFIFWLINGTIFMSQTWALSAYDRHNQREVEIISLVGSDKLQNGGLIELMLFDTQEIITGEVLNLRKIGHDVELEILDRNSNTHFFIEFPENGINEISQ